MSSFGTQKVATNPLNLGFPDPYAHWYAKSGKPEAFIGGDARGGLDMPIGTDYQAQWHQQKMRDANYMANAKVKATLVARAKAFSSPNGYYQLPPPVLGQRRFANPSNGSLFIHSTRLDVPGLAPWSEVPNGNPYVSQFARAPEKDWSMEGARLSGGVLRTTVGQDWAKAKLNDRIRQFNAINEAKMAFQTDAMGAMAGAETEGRAMPFAGAEPSIQSELAILPQVELAQLLQNIMDALMTTNYDWSGITKFLVGDANKIFALCVRLATNNSSEDIENVLEYLKGGSSADGITQLIENALATLAELEEGEDDPEATYVMRILETMKNLFRRLETYLEQMLKIANNPAKDRQNASKALIKSLGFTKLIKDDAQLFAQVGDANRDVLAYQRGNPLRPGEPQGSFSGAFIQPTGEPGEGQAYDRQLFAGLPEPPGSSSNQPIFRRGVGLQERRDARRADREYFFDQSAPRREDTQHGYVGTGGAQFSADVRGAFGDQSGRFINTVEAPGDEAEGQYNLGGRQIGWSGAEDLAQEGDDEEGAEAEGLAQLSADVSSAIPHLRSRRDPTTGSWDIAVPTPPPVAGLSPDALSPPRNVLSPTAFSPEALSPGGAPPSAGAQKPYTRGQVPSELNALKAFIQQLRSRHQGYNQGYYKTAKPGNLRRNTIKHMEAFGLL